MNKRILDLVIMMTSAIIAGWFFIFEPLAVQDAEASTGRIGYVYVRSTGIDGQNELVRQFQGQ